MKRLTSGLMLSVGMVFAVMEFPVWAADTVIVTPTPGTSVLSANPASEQSSKPVAAPPTKSGSNAIGLKVGTLGLGIEYAHGFSDSFGARVGFNSFKVNHTFNSSSIDYNLSLKEQTVDALADWYMFHGSFRTTVGLIYNPSKYTLDAQPTGGTYTINNNTYTTAQVGSLQAALDFNPIAPYLGIGWGNPAAKGKGFGMETDFGVMFQGSPKAHMSTTSTNTSVQTDVVAQQAKLQNDASKFNMYPVISVGITYQW